MKRLTFDPKFAPLILDGTKTMTHRWKNPQKIKEGDIVAAVTAKDGKPGFLIPASEAFAVLKIVAAPVYGTDANRWIGTKAALSCGFLSWNEATEFYEANKPKNATELYRFVFEVVK